MPPSPRDRGLSGDPSALVPTVLWGIVLAIGLGCTFAAYRRWHTYLWTVDLLSTPVVIALLLLWFSSAVRLLPATM